MVTKKMLESYKLRSGRGWLKAVDPKQIVGRQPHFRGAVRIDRDCKKSTKLYLSAWQHTNYLGTIIYFTIASNEGQMANWRKWYAQAVKKGNAGLKRLSILRAKQRKDEQLAKMKEVRLEAARKVAMRPKVLKREDVI